MINVTFPVYLACNLKSVFSQNQINSRSSVKLVEYASNFFLRFSNK